MAMLVWLTFCCLYFAPKERYASYKQQCDVIFKHKHCRLQALSIILDDTTFFCQIHEDLKKDLPTISI